MFTAAGAPDVRSSQSRYIAVPILEAVLAGTLNV